MDKVTEILVEALRLGAEGGEQRLYRTGKVPGLFAARNSLTAEIAARALDDGLLETVRTETKGKTTTEWVRVTSKGVAYLLEHDSPVKVLDELRGLLQANQDGIPNWIADSQRQLAELSQRLTGEVETMGRRLESLAGRVMEALKRIDHLQSPLPEGIAGALPWAHAAVEYLDKRQRSGLPERCPLPDLFAHLKDKETGLSIADFHSGLRRLHDRGRVRLLPHDGVEGPPEPEFALLDGAAVFYFAARGM
ncbi:MAG: hypothetical protein L0Y72_25045 [Gemmataceae bacterium]|nr:hypothetical protein [Gemmataceae bacterium]MCI0742312.1 hypothetical protein [Gemmataceae bacterium]